MSSDITTSLSSEKLTKVHHPWKIACTIAASVAVVLAIVAIAVRVSNAGPTGPTGPKAVQAELLTFTQDHSKSSGSLNTPIILCGYVELYYSFIKQLCNTGLNRRFSAAGRFNLGTFTNDQLFSLFEKDIQTSGIIFHDNEERIHIQYFPNKGQLKLINDFIDEGQDTYLNPSYSSEQQKSVAIVRNLFDMLLFEMETFSVTTTNQSAIGDIITRIKRENVTMNRNNSKTNVKEFITHLTQKGHKQNVLDVTHTRCFSLRYST